MDSRHSIKFCVINWNIYENPFRVLQFCWQKTLLELILNFWPWIAYRKQQPGWVEKSQGEITLLWCECKYLWCIIDPTLPALTPFVHHFCIVNLHFLLFGIGKNLANMWSMYRHKKFFVHFFLSFSKCFGPFWQDFLHIVLRFSIFTFHPSRVGLISSCVIIIG